MSKLARHLADSGLDPVETMNRLQDAGIISDECVAPEDVCDIDSERAIKFLRQDQP